MNTNILSINANSYNDVNQGPSSAVKPEEDVNNGFYYFELDNIGLFSKHDVQALAIQIETAKNEIKAIEAEIRQAQAEKQCLLSEVENIEQKLNQTKQSLFESNHKLIFSLAKNHTNKGLSFNELVREGTLGLEKAIETFEASQGLHFFTYAIFWIRLTMAQAIVKHKVCQRASLGKPAAIENTNNVIPLYA